MMFRGFSGFRVVCVGFSRILLIFSFTRFLLLLYNVGLGNFQPVEIQERVSQSVAEPEIKTQLHTSSTDPPWLPQYDVW